MCEQYTSLRAYDSRENFIYYLARGSRLIQYLVVGTAQALETPTSCVGGERRDNFLTALCLRLLRRFLCVARRGMATLVNAKFMGGGTASMRALGSNRTLPKGPDE